MLPLGHEPHAIWLPLRRQANVSSSGPPIVFPCGLKQRCLPVCTCKRLIVPTYSLASSNASVHMRDARLRPPPKRAVPDRPPKPHDRETQKGPSSPRRTFFNAASCPSRFPRRARATDLPRREVGRGSGGHPHAWPARGIPRPSAGNVLLCLNPA